MLRYSCFRLKPNYSQHHIAPMLATALDTEFLKKKKSTKQQNKWLENEKNIKRKVDLDGPKKYLWSKKLDGVRCIIHYDQKQKTPVFLSRRGLIFDSVGHLKEALSPIFQQFPTLYLDGELYNHGMDFHDIVSAVRTTKKYVSSDVKKLQKNLQFHLFDLVRNDQLLLTQRLPPKDRRKYLDNIEKADELPFQKRYQLCQYLAEKFPSPKLQLVQHAVIENTPEDIRRCHEEAVNEHYEGIMLRVPTSPYVHRRSHLLRKVKTFHDDEYRIIGMVEGKGKLKGAVGAFTCQTADKHTFNVTPSCSEEKKRELFEDQKLWKDRFITVQFQEKTEDGIPRFPIGKALRDKGKKQI